MHVYNLVMGTVYCDVEDEIKVINHKTGETGLITFTQRGWSSNPKVEGKLFDADGNQKWTVEGSWWDKMTMTELETNRQVTIFEELPPYQDYKRQFNFGLVAI